MEEEGMCAMTSQNKDGFLSPLVSRNQGPVAFSRDVIVGPGVTKTVLAIARIPTAL